MGGGKKRHSTEAKSHLNAHDIEADGTLINEAITALMMLTILEVYGNHHAIALLLSVLLRRVVAAQYYLSSKLNSCFTCFRW